VIEGFTYDPPPYHWRGAADKIDDVANPYIDQFIHGKLDGPIPVLGFGGK
jgi:hypothetical protein